MERTPTAPTDDHILMGDASRILRVSASRVNAFVAQGLLNPVRTPGRIRIFSRAEVEALRAARAEKRLLDRMVKV
jgi:DNA-binding transcriptional MerR regulator